MLQQKLKGSRDGRKAFQPTTPRLFVPLRQEGRSRVFHEAEREIAKMLAENLLRKFKATVEYKEVAGDLLFEEN